MEYWLKVKNYSDLIDATIAFLKGKLDVTPYHDGPIEDKDLAQVLIEINMNGLVTYGGQQGLIYNDDSPQWQRSWVDFIVPYSKKWLQVERKLLNDHRLDVIVYDSYSENKKQILVEYNVKNRNVTKFIDDDGNMKLYTNLPKKSIDLEDLAHDYWQETPVIEEFLRKGHYRYVTVAIKEYGVPGVERIILDYLYSTRGK